MGRATAAPGAIPPGALMSGTLHEGTLSHVSLSPHSQTPLPGLLHHLLPLGGAGLLPLPPQLHLPLGRQLLEATEVLAGLGLLDGGHGTEIPPAIPHEIPLLLRQGPPAVKAATSILALGVVHLQPARAAAGQGLLALGRQTVPLVREMPQEALLVRGEALPGDGGGAARRRILGASGGLPGGGLPGRGRRLGERRPRCQQRDQTDEHVSSTNHGWT